MGSSSSTTTGYKYYLGVHMVLCHGPVDYWGEITVDDSELVGRGFYDEGQYELDKESLFGGTDSEGGISGTMDVSFGYPTQEQNDYLQGQLGTNIPSFRGVVSFILRQMYLGTSSYLKSWAIKLQRIHVRQNGLEQWYDDKAAIGLISDTALYIAMDISLSMDVTTSNGETRFTNLKTALTSIFNRSKISINRN